MICSAVNVFDPLLDTIATRHAFFTTTPSIKKALLNFKPPYYVPVKNEGTHYAADVNISVDRCLITVKHFHLCGNIPYNYQYYTSIS